MFIKKKRNSDFQSFCKFLPFPLSARKSKTVKLLASQQTAVTE